jgi:outer membrane protein assembly factor BamA
MELFLSHQSNLDYMISMKRHLIPIFLLIPFVSLAQELPNISIPVDTVIISVNEKTDEEVILREIPYAFPDTLQVEDFLIIQNRIQNLFLFNQVEVYPIEDGFQNILLVSVKETWYIYPVPILFINERDWDKLSYGFQISHFNFRGKNEKINIGGWAGYNPSFFLNYYNPWVGKNSKFIFGIDFSKRKIENKFVNFDEDHLGFGVTLGKRFGLNSSVQTSFSLNRIKFPEEYQPLLVSNSDKDIVPRITLRFQHDRRDLYEYPMKGYYLNWSVTRTGFTDSQPQFWRWQFDHRLYVKLWDRLSIGGRNLVKINRGTLPIYDHIFIGYSDRIRGYFDRVFTAQNLMLQNIELRISIFPIKHLSWNKAPLFSKLFQGLKYGLSMGFFVDTGTVWNRTDQISMNRLFTGYGGGLHFHVPYLNLIRVEHTWSDAGNGEWIIDALVSF